MCYIKICRRLVGLLALLRLGLRLNLFRVLSSLKFRANRALLIGAFNRRSAGTHPIKLNRSNKLDSMWLN